MSSKRGIQCQIGVYVIHRKLSFSLAGGILMFSGEGSSDVGMDLESTGCVKLQAIRLEVIVRISVLVASRRSACQFEFQVDFT